jgi:hypothetical protein
MPQEAIAGLIGFGVFFTMWVVLPNLLHKRHEETSEEHQQ